MSLVWEQLCSYRIEIHRSISVWVYLARSFSSRDVIDYVRQWTSYLDRRTCSSWFDLVLLQRFFLTAYHIFLPKISIAITPTSRWFGVCQTLRSIEILDRSFRWAAPTIWSARPSWNHLSIIVNWKQRYGKEDQSARWRYCVVTGDPGTVREKLMCPITARGDHVWSQILWHKHN